MKRIKKFAAVIAAAGILTGSMTVSVCAEEEKNYEPLGQYTETGYENTFFDLKCEFPEGFTHESRGFIIQTTGDQAEIISHANEETTLSGLEATMNLGGAVVFEAIGDGAVVSANLQGAGPVNSGWEDSETVAEGSIDSWKKSIEEWSEDGTVIEDIKVEKAQIKFMDEDMWGLDYSFAMDGMPVYGKAVILISDDEQYCFSVDAYAVDPTQVDAMLGSFSRLS